MYLLITRALYQRISLTGASSPHLYFNPKTNGCSNIAPYLLSKFKMFYRVKFFFLLLEDLNRKFCEHLYHARHCTRCFSGISYIIFTAFAKASTISKGLHSVNEEQQFRQDKKWQSSTVQWIGFPQQHTRLKMGKSKRERKRCTRGEIYNH